MGKNTSSTVGKAAKVKSEGEQSPKQSASPPKNDPPHTAPSPDTASNCPGNTLMDSLEDLKAKIEALLHSAAAVQATSLSMHIDSLQSHLTNSERDSSEKVRLQQLLAQKDDQIETSQEQLSRLMKGWKKEETEYEERLNEVNRELEAALADRKSLRNDMEQLIVLHEKEKEDLETEFQHRMEARVGILETNHQEKVHSLENRLEELESHLAETQERLQHSEAQSSCAVFEKSQLIRETERAKHECTRVKERFDMLLFIQDDSLLGIKFDQLAYDIINFAVRFARNLGSSIDTQQMPKVVMNCGFIPITDSSCSKILRISWVVKYISKAFLKYLFQPFGQYMNRDDHKRIAQMKELSRALILKDPTKEAIWRNLTLQAMKASGEYGFLTSNGTDPTARLKQDRDMAREELFQSELESLLPVLNADMCLMEDIKTEFNTLIRTAAELWIDARRNVEPIEASQDVAFSIDSNWDNKYTDFMETSMAYNRESGGNGVPINSPVDTDIESVYTRSGDDNSRSVKLCLFPKILRVSQGTPVVIHQGLALFEGGSLVTQGEEEVTEQRIRELELQKLKRKKHFRSSKIDSSSSRRASQSHYTPTMDTPEKNIGYSCNHSNHSGTSTADDSLIDAESTSSTRKLEAMMAAPMQESFVHPDMLKLSGEHQIQG